MRDDGWREQGIPIAAPNTKGSLVWQVKIDERDGDKSSREAPLFLSRGGGEVGGG